jgi:hypothetical protein
MKSNACVFLPRLVLLGVALLTPATAGALAITSGSLTISNIQITAGAGTVVIDLWTAQASATANNSLGESAGQFDSTAINSGTTAQADATVTWANSHGTANLSNLTATGTSAIILPGINNQTDSSGVGDLFTTFSITGGTGAVDVTFAMALAASQDGTTDGVGSVTRNELVASLTVDAISDPVLFFDSLHTLGPNSTFSDTQAPTLANTATLMFDTPYFMFIEADSEANAMNVPEPGTLALLALSGMAMMVSGAARTRRHQLEVTLK